MRRLTIILGIAFFLFAGCSSSSTSYYWEPPPRLPLEKTKLKGEVLIFDNNCNLIADRSGVLVVIDSGAYQTTTNKNGLWECPSYRTGNYSYFHCSKPGFYSSETSEYIDKWDTAMTIGPLVIGKAPTFSVTLDAVIMPDPPPDSQTTFSGGIFSHSSDDVPDSVRINLYVIVGRTPYLNIENPASYESGFIPYTGDEPGNGSRNIASYFYWDLLSAFKSNETVYFKAYPIFESSVYYNAKLGKYVSDGIGLSPSNVLSATKK